MSKLTVTVPSDATATFAAAADLAAELGIPLPTGSDPALVRLTSLLASATSLIADFIGRPLLVQTVVEVFSAAADDIPPVFEWRRRNPVLVLSVVPVVEIDMLSVRGLEYVPPEGFDLDNGAGILRLPLGLIPFCNRLSPPSISVEYRGGYALPGSNAIGPVLPETIRRATIEIAAGIWLRTGANTRDPSVVREQTENVGMTEYAPPAAGEVGSIPGAIAARLAAYRDARL